MRGSSGLKLARPASTPSSPTRANPPARPGREPDRHVNLVVDGAGGLPEPLLELAGDLTRPRRPLGERLKRGDPPLDLPHHRFADPLDEFVAQGLERVPQHHAGGVADEDPAVLGDMNLLAERCDQLLRLANVLAGLEGLLLRAPCGRVRPGARPGPSGSPRPCCGALGALLGGLGDGLRLPRAAMTPRRPVPARGTPSRRCRPRGWRRPRRPPTRTGSARSPRGPWRGRRRSHHGLLHQVLADARVRDPDAHRDRPQRGQDGNRTGPAGQKTQADR